jgi:serine/threonine protein kinase
MPAASQTPSGFQLFRPGAWSIVTQAPDWDPAIVRKKLDELTSIFWRPAYAYIRYAAGLKRKEALRATERYLATFAETPVHLMTPEVRSRFRVFTRTSVKIFVATGRHQEEGDESSGIRRLEAPPEGGEITQELEAAIDADQAFDREWVRALFDRAFQGLRQKLDASGELIFERVLSEYDLQPVSEEPVSLSAIARNLEITRVDARVSLSYARTVLRRILLSLVNDTLLDPADMGRETEELIEISKGDGPPWALIRRLLPADDDFMLLQLVLESGSLNSNQMRELAQLMELSGTHITKALTEMGTLQPSQLEPLMALKESRINAILQSSTLTRASPSVREEIPEGLEDLMRDSRNFLGKFLKIEPMSDAEREPRWKCYDTQTRKYVSVVFLHQKTLDRTVSRDLVLASQIQHPNIVPVLDYGTIGSDTYVAASLIQGESLAGKRMSERRALEIVYEIARAVEDAHSRGLSHGDLRSECILLDREGHVHIAEFGVAKLFRPQPVAADESLVPTGNGQADTNFLLPGVREQEIRVDVLGLGAILYELLTGKDPFDGKAPSEWAVSPGDLPSARRFNSDVRFATDDLLRRALKGHEGERFETCREFALAILRLLKGETIELPAVNPEPAKPQVPELVRRGALALAILILLLLAFAVGRGTGGPSSAEDHLRKADAAFEEERFEEALRHYAAVQALRPDLERARERYEECRRRLGAGGR